ncbi:MAG: DUF3592 domain-containing protein [Planctomycetota bacterium]
MSLSKSFRVLRWPAILIIFIGIGFGIFSVIGGIGKSTVQGMVVRLTDESNTSPIVEYEVDGVVYAIEGSVSSSPAAPRPGDRVNILYDAKDPTNSQIDTFRERWLLPAGLVFAGLNTLLMTFYLPWFIKRAGLS